MVQKFSAIFIIIYYLSQISLSYENEIEDFNRDLNRMLFRAYERIALFDKLIDEIENEFNVIQTSNGNRFEGHSPTAQEEFFKNYKKLKAGLQEVSSESELKELIIGMQTELLNYYDNIRTESLLTRKFPNMDKHMFEIKLLDIMPKYTDKLVNILIETLKDPSENFKLADKDIHIISEQFRKMAHLFKEQLIKPLKKEIEEHPKQWRVLDPFDKIVNGETFDSQRWEQDVDTAFIRSYIIFSNFLSNNEQAFNKFYDCMKKYSKQLGIEYLFENKEINEEMYNIINK